MNKRLGTLTTLLLMLFVTSTGFAQYTGGSYDGYGVGTSGSDISLPVELTSFSASVDRSGAVALEWVTESEIENLGFILERRNWELEIRIGRRLPATKPTRNCRDKGVSPTVRNTLIPMTPSKKAIPTTTAWRM